MQDSLQQTAFATGAGPDNEYVEFCRAGEYGKGEFLCVSCGYVMIAYHRELPECPMCKEGLWERNLWSPFARNAFAHLGRRLELTHDR